MITIEQLLADRAAAMAAHDGVAAGVVHFHGAANQLQVELLTARDRLIQTPAEPDVALTRADVAVSEAAIEEVEEPPAPEAEAEPSEAEAPAAEAEEAAS